ncbi:MAG: hypothetical protein OEV42_01670 [Deltaproteobacteria bacterium]|nr:hypothetical protein [Deltaproteobacteria bacterium]
MNIFLSRFLLSLIFLIALCGNLFAESSPFRENFTAKYKALKFEELALLVKKNKDILPSEILAMIIEADSPEMAFEDKINLLDIANTMAYMFTNWHGSNKEVEKYLKVIVQMISKEVAKENARVAKLMKWKKQEAFLGNFVMKKNMKAMQKKGLAPVLYPHWTHRIWFECKVCHEDIFTMKRWSNNLSHNAFKEGKTCGTCHDGKLAFHTEKDCINCHVAGKAESAHLYKTDAVNHDKIKKVAEKVGSKWYPEKLKDGKLPLDKFGFINWAELVKGKYFTPLPSLSNEVKEETRDNKILFESRSRVVKNVLFDHGIHSDLIKCSVCHPAIFIDKVGANNMKMTFLAAGQFCGRCHGKVSFPIKDCKRCHNVAKTETPEGVLIHENKAKQG